MKKINPQIVPDQIILRIFNWNNKVGRHEQQAILAHSVSSHEGREGRQTARISSAGWLSKLFIQKYDKVVFQQHTANTRAH